MVKIESYGKPESGERPKVWGAFPWPFIYRARKPFHPKRLYELIHDKFILLQDRGEDLTESDGEESSSDDVDENMADETGPMRKETRMAAIVSSQRAWIRREYWQTYPAHFSAVCRAIKASPSYSSYVARGMVPSRWYVDALGRFAVILHAWWRTLVWRPGGFGPGGSRGRCGDKGGRL